MILYQEDLNIIRDLLGYKGTNIALDRTLLEETY